MPSKKARETTRETAVGTLRAIRGTVILTLRVCQGVNCLIDLQDLPIELKLLLKVVFKLAYYSHVLSD
jgi:hypothetical protein